MRVALATAAVVLVTYALGALVLDAVVVSRLTAQADARLAQALGSSGGNAAGCRPDRGAAGDDGPGRGHRRQGRRRGRRGHRRCSRFAWFVSGNGKTLALTTGRAPPPDPVLVGRPTTVDVAGTPFRFQAKAEDGGWLVVGESLAAVDRVHDVLVGGELAVGVAVVVATFLGALAVGLLASAPVEVVRRRQAQFTADASHELRTPLSVIEAEVAVTLARPRERPAYEEALHRVSDEAQRLRAIVDDLLWLARMDDERQVVDPRATADAVVVAGESADRFRHLAAAHQIDLRLAPLPDEAWVRVGPGVVGPPGRRAPRQRLQVRGRRWARRRRGALRRRRGDLLRGRLGPRGPPRRAGRHLRPVPPRHRRAPGLRPRAGHRRCHRPGHRRPVDRRALATRRGPVLGPVAPGVPPPPGRIRPAARPERSPAIRPPRHNPPAPPRTDRHHRASGAVGGRPRPVPTVRDHGGGRGPTERRADRTDERRTHDGHGRRPRRAADRIPRRRPRTTMSSSRAFRTTGRTHRPRDEGRPPAPGVGGRVVVLAGLVVLVLVVLVVLVGDQIGTTRAADRDRATTGSGRPAAGRSARRTCTPSSDRLASAREQLGEATTALASDQSQLAGARTALQHAQQDASSRVQELAQLHACLVGVEGALNALSVQDGTKAVASLTAVEPSCQAASAGV